MVLIKDPIKKYSDASRAGDAYSTVLIATGTGTPTSGTKGDIVFDTVGKKLWVHDGSSFVGVVLS